MVSSALVSHVDVICHEDNLQPDISSVGVSLVSMISKELARPAVKVTVTQACQAWLWLVRDCGLSRLPRGAYAGSFKSATVVPTTSMVMAS